MIDGHLVEVHEYSGSGYKPLFSSGEWVVACLNYLDAARPENVETLESHSRTDETFIPVKGQGQLLIKQADSPIEFITLVPGKTYQVKQGVWHGLVMEEGAQYFIVKSKDQMGKDVRHLELSPEEINQIKGYFG